MRLQNFRFNKEKLVALGALCLLAPALYLCLRSAPAALGVGTPISSLAPPPEVAQGQSAYRNPDENWYPLGGTDPRTGEYVNRDRHSPFMPADRKIVSVIPKPAPATHNAALPPRQSVDVENSIAAPSRIWTPVDPSLKYEYMGVITVNAGTYALLRPKDGAKPRRLQTGDTIAGDYTVRKIEKQSVWLVDDHEHFFQLRSTALVSTKPFAASRK